MKILDHGYVELIESWGSDERVIEAARMSTGKGFNGWGAEGSPGDEKLLAYLYNHKHMTPFEMAGMIIEVKAPIFVFREWHRHRTQSYNEMSARYIPLPNENYIPSVERLMMHGGANKQAQSIGKSLSEEEAKAFQMELQDAYHICESVYQIGLAWGFQRNLLGYPFLSPATQECGHQPTCAIGWHS